MIGFIIEAAIGGWLIYKLAKPRDPKFAKSLEGAPSLGEIVKNHIDKKLETSRRRYNDLPELGKARVEIKMARTGKYVGSIGAPVAMYTFWSCLVGPLFALVPTSIALRWAKRWWGDCNEVIEDAQQRRASCIHPPCGVKGCTLPIDLAHTHNH